MTMVSNDIAVIGIGCRFPGADTAEQFYDNLLGNKDCVDEIPERRWSHRQLFTPDGGKNHISSKWGGFISNVDQFDARFFKILPSEAEQLDPQQKLFLTCSWEALEDAGYSSRRKSAGRAVGVYAGVTWNEFSLYASEYGYLKDDYKGAGALYWGIPNRVSYFFDFAGPSIAVDTACSSSLVALHLAAQGLREGDCEMALAGGINLNLHPAKYLFLSGSGFLSSEGKCRGFGEGGDGYVPSEGVGVLLLKTLAAAERDGDRIYGVIKSTATNHGGKATGYTVPNPRSHQAVIRSALQRAGVTARDISYVECHGTGTDLGDPIEVAGLRMAYEEVSRERQFCGIGTVKSNIGHCEAAAGVAGIIKLLMSMRAGIIPATLYAETPNRKIDFEHGPFYLVQENMSWDSTNEPVLAGLSSFGAGGSNSHCVLQSYVPSRVPSKRKAASPYCIPVSATSAERCAAYSDKLLDYLIRYSDTALADLSHTLVQRETFPHRVVFVVNTVSSLVELLLAYRDDFAKPGIRLAEDVEIRDKHHALIDWANAWIAGNGVELEEMPPKNSKGRLLSLPTYAFEPVRSWIHPSNYLYRRQRPAGAVLHPLVDENISSIKGGAFKKSLHRDEYFVEEHWVNSDPVLPGVCIAEMARFCAETFLGNPQVTLSEIWFLEPITLANLDRVEIHVRLGDKGDSRFFEVLSGNGSVKHASGQITRVESEPASPVVEHPVRLLADLPNTLSRDQAYARFAQSGIEQQGRFKVVSEFRYGDTQAVARLKLAPACDDQEKFGLHPTLMDGAVQTAMLHLYMHQTETKTVLPFQIGAFVRHRPLSSTVYAIARLKSLESLKYDVVICDSAGSVLAELRNFVLKEFQNNSEHPRTLAFAPSMQECKLPEIATPDKEVSLCLLAPPTALFSTEMPPAGWSFGVWSSVAEDCSLPPFRIENLPNRITQVAFLLERIPACNSKTLYSSVTALSKQLFNIGQSLARREVFTDALFCIGDTGTGGDVFGRMATALFRCLNRELSKVRFRLLVMPTQEMSTADFCKRIAAEFEDGQAELYVRYVGDSRQIQVLREVNLDRLPRVINERPSAWMISGGGGGLGLTLANHLLSRGERVMLIGRSPLNDVRRARLSGYPAENWAFVQCDLTQPSRVKEAVAFAREWHNGSWGLAHCAGTIDDGAFLSKKWENFQEVLAAKAETLLTLCEHQPELDLKRVVLFSSLTAVTGNRGQTDYALANGFLDGFAEVAQCYFPQGVAVTAVNWPYWTEGGMRIDEEKMADYTKANLSEPLPTAEGLSLFDTFGDTAGESVALVYGKTRLTDMLRHTALKPMTAPKITHEADRDDVIRYNHDPDGANKHSNNKHSIQAFLISFLERELKLDLTDDDLEVDFSDLGVDSIAQMDLINKLEQEQRFSSVPQTLLLDNANITALTEFFYRHHANSDYSLDKI